MGEAAPSWPPGVVRASRLGRPGEAAPSSGWSLRRLSGRLTELSGEGDGACLTLAVSTVLEAQREGETTVWVVDGEDTFFPPDAAAHGVDLEALPVVRVSGTGAVARAADRLTRSGGFGLVVLDLGSDPRIPVAAQARLGSLAREHDVAVLCLTEKREEDASLGSMIALRGEARRRREAEDRFVCEVRALKDKHRGPGWTHAETFRGPHGFH